MEIRQIKEQDYDSIREISFMLWLSIQWNGSYHKEDAFVILDESNAVIGVTALAWDATMYYIDRVNQQIPLYRLQLEIEVSKKAEQPEEVKRMLLQSQIAHFNCMQEQYPDKRMCMRCWCYDDEKDKMQVFLQNSFFIGNVVMVLGYDLRTKIACAPFRQDIKVDIMPKEETMIQRYLRANEQGYDGVQDSADEFRFRLQSENTEVFIACDGEDIVSSCTIWQITPQRYATENVFTVPKYRGLGYGKAVLSTALQRIRELGGQEATLTVIGDNRIAIDMYIKMGYTLRQNMLEMHYMAEQSSKNRK